MKVLWLCNTPLYIIGKKIGYITYTESWLNAIADELLKKSNFKLVVMFPHQLSKKLLKGNIGCLSYYGFYRKQLDEQNTNSKIVGCMRTIIKTEKPDIIHIFGTEYIHSLEMLQVSNRNRTVISIQGLISLCGQYYADGMPILEIHRMRKVKQRCCSIASEIKNFQKRGENEISSIKKCKYIIGRTQWDEACVTNINPSAIYFHCNETMRKEFYEKEWCLEHAEQFSILISQGNYPLKGLHYMIEAMTILCNRYPKCRVYITGNSDFIKNKEKTPYGQYCYNMILKYRLKDRFQFIGYHSPINMRDRFLKSHVMVLCSNIENSPNCIGEAMLLGVPVVAAFVGGIPDLLQHGIDGYLYQHNAPYMLAKYISKIFDNNLLAKELSRNAREKAKVLYDRNFNREVLLSIYNEILNRN